MKRLTHWSLSILTVIIMVLAAACVSSDDPNKRAKKGAAIGAVTGAAAGAVIGNQSDNPKTGAVVGAAVGAGVGAAIGHMMDKQQQELERIEGVEVTRTAEDEINVVMENDILFDFDSAALRADSRQSLRDMASVFVEYPDTRIDISGHTDSVGSASYNQNLSEERARAVTRYLTSQGVSPTRITARGYGESLPTSSNETAAGRQLNRRVEIQITAIPQG
ncbi:MAG: OmpA family protein [Acidobacteria bacterium]|nr:OmpA family protein [Acidobacteriota bacterium]